MKERGAKVVEWVPGKWWVVEGYLPDVDPPWVPLRGPFASRAKAQGWLDARGCCACGRFEVGEHERFHEEAGPADPDAGQTLAAHTRRRCLDYNVPGAPRLTRRGG